MGRGVCVLATGVLVAVLGACSTATDPALPSPAAPTTPPATSAVATSSPTGSATTTSITTSGPTSSTAPGPSPEASPTTSTISRGRVPAGLSPDAQAVTDAWFAYWEFVGTSLSDPSDPSAISDVGKVATGKAAAALVTQIAQQKDAGQRIVGQIQVDVTTATAAGTSGTVCSPVVDLSYGVDARGARVNAPQVRNATFQGKLTRDGPVWRVAERIRTSC